MKANYLALLGFTAATVFAPVALANQIHFSFNGAGISSSGLLTVSQTSTSGSARITGISGMFSDSNVGVSGSIGGLYTPVSYQSDTSKGIAFTAGGLSYDDLFYPAGNSPVLCFDAAGNPTYPFSGGQLDIYGVAFNIAGPGGYVAELWSNGYLPDSKGTFPGAPGYVPNLVYAAALANAKGLVDNPNAGGDVIPPGVYGSFTTTAVPEPGSLALFGVALLGLFVTLLGRKRRSAGRSRAVEVSS
ncbi:MAG: PEP-CTERM sorting domain-containing protein [Salinisphaera sp.]|jgi:hypothetical protein|nr:PEP-CTERM sorting domain-containing protein [Salinisphaera sp.]